MSILSHYCRNKLYGSLLGMDTFPKPHIFIGFSTSAPVDPPGTVTEPIADDYNRTLYTHWKIVGRNVSNNTTITAYTRSAWGTLTHFLLWDAAEGGNLLGYGAFPSPVTVTTGKVLSFSKGKLQFQIQYGVCTDYLANRFLEHLFGNIALASVNTYVGLSYTNPGDAGVPITPLNTDYHDLAFLGWDVSTVSELTNIETINFIPRSDWGILPYMFIRDTENRVLIYSPFITPLPANIYNHVIIDPYFLTIVFD